jgi:2-isopropylmalate synthase
MRIHTFDTTLRDGTQGESVSYSVDDKLSIMHRLDELGIDYIEGGWPGSNPKDKDFFARAKDFKLKHAKLTAFGSTRFARNSVESDPNVAELIAANTPVVAIFGKSWDLHTTRALGITEEENLKLIGETVAFLRWSTTLSISSTAFNPIRTSRFVRSKLPRRPAPMSWCFATQTAER